MDSVVINGVEYVKGQENSPIKIVILQRGWVMVGYWHREGNDCQLTNASVIRTWGTTKGLGEIVPKPTDKTTLDKCGTVNFDFLTVVATIDCEVSGWQSRL
jgi:hypothetical protein